MCSVLKRAEEKRKLGQQTQKAEKAAAKGAGAQSQSDLPVFERHSKGIGSKLMAMMG